MAAQTDRGIPLSALSPKFLHTNSTSHTWPFSAIAELVDNAYDPDVSAKQFWIDKTKIRNVDCLTFMDNGAGLSYEKMYKMLSFGFSDKQAVNGHVPVGLYGNGFKSGSMRLGKDAIVFSKTHDGMCVGMLSQTYLEKTKASHVVVPIVAYRSVGPNVYGSTAVARPDPKHMASLQDILNHSLFHTERDLHSELRAITSTGTMTTTGTRIIIWNLRQTSTGQNEFDFLSDRYDFRIPPSIFETNKEMYRRPERVMEASPESDYSLRAYCSILYLNPRMQIIIRGQKVKTQLISKSLAYIRKDSYKPNFLYTRVRITFGYNTKSKEHYGIMMYHKNRLIKAYERVGCQLKANNKGVGVIGVIECNFLKPTHNKQDFDYTDEYRKTINSVALKLEEYWREIRYKSETENPTCSIPVEDTFKRPDQNWVQCDRCLQWRKLPDGIDPERLPDQWYCHMNPDPQFRNCQVPQEAADSDDESSYPKTYKHHERHKRIEQEKQQQMQEQQKKKQEMQMLARLEQQNEQLRQQLCRQLRETREAPAVRVSVPPPPLRSALATAPHTSRALGQADSSPSSGVMPIITNVRSLSTPTRMKRTHTPGPGSGGAKRARSGHSPGTASEAAATATSSPAASCSSSTVVIPDDDEDNCINGGIISEEDDDDEIVIDETKSTPKPKQPSFDISRVKTEQNGEVSGMHMECTEDAALEAAEPAPAATPACSPSSPGQQGQVSTTTQTETSATIKEENEEGGRNNAEPNTTEAEGEGEERTEPEVSHTEDQGTACAAKAAADAAEAVAEEMDVQSAEEGCSAHLQGREGKESSSEGADRELTDHVSDHVSDHMSDAIQAMEAEPQTDGEREGGVEVAVTSPPPAQPAPSQRESNLLMEAQQQQDQLMEIMEKTAKERDAYQGEVHQLIVKVEDLEEQLTQSRVKKEQSHQLCQTDEAEAEDDKGFVNLQQQIEKLQKERDALLKEKKQWEERNCGEGTSSSVQKGQSGKEEACSSQVNTVDDELALQVDFLLRELDQGNVERDKLKAKLSSLELEKTELASRTEQLQKELEELRKSRSTAPAGVSAGQSSAVDSSQEEERVDTARGSPQSHQAQAQAQASGSGAEPRQNGAASDVKKKEGTQQEDSKAAPSSQTHGSPDRPVKEEQHKLSELRRSVGRLLVTFVPALDLDQVNYDCSVIDEILDQVLQEITQNDNGIDAT
ncbi:hypothetical protein ACEWY4_023247 [Coilia grayii]|uniref:CW-type domain-containing protein n=1 Tax=Coilia grayii TaxID=363190 RepID=A0ABD1J2G4_9TELE